MKVKTIFYSFTTLNNIMCNSTVQHISYAICKIQSYLNCTCMHIITNSVHYFSLCTSIEDLCIYVTFICALGISLNILFTLFYTYFIF